MMKTRSLAGVFVLLVACSSVALPQKSATRASLRNSASSASPWLIIFLAKRTTETQITQRLRRENSLQPTSRAVPSSVAYSQSLVEEFSFTIKDFRMDHQTQTNNLNISISYHYIVNIRKSEYPDFRWLAKDVETLLASYPNKDDYWEIVNKQITSLLLDKYPGITSVTSDLKVDPSSLIPYARSSRVTRERNPSKANRKRS